MLIRDDEMALAILHQLRGIGVGIALDDFGTGYSSLSYLQRFPFDKVEIDRSFIRDIVAPGGSSSIVQAVVTIAAARNMITTAEGVETADQLDALRHARLYPDAGFSFQCRQAVTRDSRHAPEARDRRRLTLAGPKSSRKWPVLD